MQRALALIVSARDPEEVVHFTTKNRWTADIAELHIVINPLSEGRGQASLGAWLQTTTTQPMCGLIHADVELNDADLDALQAVVAEGDVAGIVGVTTSEQLWGFDAKVTTEVETLDGCAIFWPTAHPLTWDAETFPGFHAVVPDVCTHAKSLGRRVVVPPLSHGQHTGVSTPTREWQDQWWAAKSKLCGKWGRLVITT